MSRSAVLDKRRGLHSITYEVQLQPEVSSRLVSITSYILVRSDPTDVEVA